MPVKTRRVYGIPWNWDAVTPNLGLWEEQQVLTIEPSPPEVWPYVCHHLLCVGITACATMPCFMQCTQGAQGFTHSGQALLHLSYISFMDSLYKCFACMHVYVYHVNAQCPQKPKGTGSFGRTTGALKSRAVSPSQMLPLSETPVCIFTGWASNYP